MSAIETVVETWHRFIGGAEPGALERLLDEDVVFHSPIVYRPQEGKALTTLYLSAAVQTFPKEGTFTYTKQVLGDDTAILEFETTMDGKYVNGVDIIRCNADGRIVEFRVMIRPLQAVNAVHQQMAAMLEALQEQGPTD